MRRFVEGVDRRQTTLFPESLDDWIGEDNPVRVIEAFVEALDLTALGFDGVIPRPLAGRHTIPRSCSSSTSTAISTGCSRAGGLEREAGRNVELMWLTGRLVPDHKTIANFRKDNGRAIRRCAHSSLPFAASLGC